MRTTHIVGHGAAPRSGRPVCDEHDELTSTRHSKRWRSKIQTQAIGVMPNTRHTSLAWGLRGKARGPFGEGLFRPGSFGEGPFGQGPSWGKARSPRCLAGRDPLWKTLSARGLLGKAPFGQVPSGGRASRPGVLWPTFYPGVFCRRPFGPDPGAQGRPWGPGKTPGAGVFWGRPRAPGSFGEDGGVRPR